MILIVGAITDSNGDVLNSEILADDKKIPNGLIDGMFYSATMFTSLGFSNYVPVSIEAKFFSIFQSLLGGAHSVAFVFVMLGRKRFKVSEPVSVGGGVDEKFKQCVNAKLLKIKSIVTLLVFLALVIVALLVFLAFKI